MARKRLKFRRNIFKRQSYHQGPSPLSDQSREQRRQSQGRQTNFKRLALLLSVIAGLLVLGYFFGFIRQVEVAGLDQPAEAEVQAIADDYFDSNWYRRFKPLSSINQLAGSIELADSRFSGTKAEMSWFSDKVTIKSQLRRPAARLSLPGNNQVYLIDEDGVVYQDEAATTSDLPAINDQTGLQAEPGQKFIGTDKLDFIVLLDSQMDAAGLYENQQRTYLITNSPREIQLTISGTAYAVRFITSRAVSDQVAELESLLDYLTSIKRTPSRYIDLRVDDTAYYL